VGRRHRAPRGAAEPSGGGRPSPPCRRSGAVKLGAARSGRRRGGWKRPPTTTRRASTARWSGLGKRDGKAHVRNQRLNASQESHQLESGGSGLDCSAHPHHHDDGALAVGVARGTPGLGDVAGREAAVKVCGVAAAMLQGHSWAPTPSIGSAVNVGTIPAVPEPRRNRWCGGKVRPRPMLSGWGGGPVVVRGWESRPHGEGVQRVRSRDAEQGVRW
jgi:hypothetical protein